MNSAIGMKLYELCMSFLGFAFAASCSLILFLLVSPFTSYLNLLV